jgi:hypothetical protein
MGRVCVCLCVCVCVCVCVILSAHSQLRFFASGCPHSLAAGCCAVLCCLPDARLVAVIYAKLHSNSRTASPHGHSPLTAWFASPRSLPRPGFAVAHRRYASVTFSVHVPSGVACMCVFTSFKVSHRPGRRCLQLCQHRLPLFCAYLSC